MSLHTESASQAPYDARAVANSILDRAAKLGAPLTQMQLYKIVYFAHGWYLAAHQKKLVSQSFEAWSYGPVVRVLREAFRNFGKEKITQKAEKFDIFTGELKPIQSIANDSDIEFINKIFEFYHVYDGWTLSEITHEQGSPWDRVWNASKPVGNLGLRIDDGEIFSYFSRLPKRFPMH